MSLLLLFRSPPAAVTGTVVTSQAQTIAGTGTATPQAISGTATTSQAQTAAASGTSVPQAITGTATTSQAQTVAASGTSFPAAVTGTGATSQAQTVAGSGSIAGASVSGTGSTSQAQTTAGSGTATPQAITGTATTSQAQTVSGSGDFVASAGVTGTVSTAQAQTSGGIGEVVNAGIQPIHGYSFENDRRLLKARREKERLDKLSFTEQLEAIKPQIAKIAQTDTEAATAFVDRITALVPKQQVQRISTAIDYPIVVGYQSDSSDDEAIALIVAALL